MTEPYIAGIVLFAGNFAPRGWAFCQGQILSIAQNTALFSLLGTTYGGNGQTTFALPDLRGRVPRGPGQGPGLANVDLGEQAGAESVTLTVNTMPAHAHAASPANLKATVNIINTAGTQQGPKDNVLAKEAAGVTATYATPPQGFPSNPLDKMADAAVTMAGTTDPNGGNQPFGIHTPYLGINYIIAIQGIFPSRN